MEEQTKQKFTDFLSLNNILCNIDVADSADMLSKLFDALKRHYPNLDVESALNEVKARESVFPSVVAPGLAVPHARIAGLPMPLVAMACAPAGIKQNGGDPIFISILILTPQDEPNLHLQILSALSCAFSDGDVLRKLAALPDADAVFEYLKSGHSGNGENAMPAYLVAADVMHMPPATLLETDTVGHAIRTFATTQCDELPVLDSAGDLRGVMALSDLLRHSLPTHVLWMEDLTPIYQFQPFAELLKTAEEEKIADVMREKFHAVEATVPAVQLAKLFLVNKISQLLITRDGKFAGVVELKSFCARLFWE